jgi:hypothetical protein
MFFRGSPIEERKVQKSIKQHEARGPRSRPGFLRPVIVAELLVVMMLAGAGASFALEPHAVGPTATPGPSATPIAGDSLAITHYALLYNPQLTQVIGVTVTVKNKDAAAAHSGTVNVAVDQEGDSITGQGPVTNLAAGATTQVTINLGPIDIGTYLETMRVIVTQTS